MDSNTYEQSNHGPEDPDIAPEQKTNDASDHEMDAMDEIEHTMSEDVRFILEEEPDSEEEADKADTVESADAGNEEDEFFDEEEIGDMDDEEAEEGAEDSVPDPDDSRNRPDVSNELRLIVSGIHEIGQAMNRLEEKFELEILNGENRNNTVKTIYKELNEYKAGIVESALKWILYDIADLREIMLRHIKDIQEKESAGIPLEDFMFYAEAMADLLEKYDVHIYKGEPDVENIPVRQKIVYTVPTDDGSKVKKVAESLSFGYEYNHKILYPERISIYVKKEEKRSNEDE